MKKDAQYWIEKLQMQPHPEGGFFSETYRSEGTIEGLDRSFATGIYFLLLEENFSAFHRIKSDEMWHFYAGDQVQVMVLDEKGGLQVIKLGPDPEKGEQFQFVVSANQWFASRMASGEGFALVGCTVSPGFDFNDFELADRQRLIQDFPQHQQIITELTRV